MDDIKGLKPLLTVEPPTGWLAAAVVVGVLVLGLFALWVNRRRATAEPDVDEGLGGEAPPGWDASDWLDDLATRGWIERGAVREFHVGLATILRAHLREAWQVPAEWLTTPETVEALAARVESPTCSALAALLAACDAAKFAGEGASAEVMRERLQVARGLVAEGPRPVLLLVAETLEASVAESPVGGRS